MDVSSLLTYPAACLAHHIVMPCVLTTSALQGCLLFPWAAWWPRPNPGVLGLCFRARDLRLLVKARPAACLQAWPRWSCFRFLFLLNESLVQITH